MTYSLEFRLQVLSVKQKKDLSFSETAERFGVGVASIVRWVKNPEPRTHRHKPPAKQNMDALKEDIHLYPDAYQYERGERLGVIPIIKNIYQRIFAHFLVVSEPITSFDAAKRFHAWQQALRIS